MHIGFRPIPVVRVLSGGALLGQQNFQFPENILLLLYRVKMGVGDIFDADYLAEMVLQAVFIWRANPYPGIFALAKLICCYINHYIAIGQPDVAFSGATQLKRRHNIKLVIAFAFKIGIQHFTGIVAPQHRKSIQVAARIVQVWILLRIIAQGFHGVSKTADVQVNVIKVGHGIWVGVKRVKIGAHIIYKIANDLVKI